ncbi:UGT2A1.2 family protein [Megaselia abdita]
MKLFNYTFAFLVCCLLANVSSYKILGVFPFAATSHYIVGSSLMKGLAEKGHDVTIIAAFKEKSPIKNFKTILVPEAVALMEETKKDIINYRNKGILESLAEFYEMGINMTQVTLESANVKKLLKSNEKFDLVINEIFLNEAALGIAHVFKAPIIGVSTFGSSQWTTDLVGSPTPPSYIPNPFLGFSTKMSLVERVGNLAQAHFDRIYFDHFYIHKQEKIYNKAFPDPKPALDQLRKNVSLVLLNTHFSLAFPRPYVPNMIEVGGMQVNRKTKELPADMKKFIESAEHGVIYFSMGSNLKSNTLPKEKRDALLNTFKTLKQKVLWKWEDPNLPGKPDNVFISAWFPQDDVLAHPNVKAFITHGGLLSTTETIYHGTPVIGIPMFGDQFLNMAQAVKGGFGLIADYNLLSVDYLKGIINEMMTNDKYTKQIQAMSKRYRDQPLTPLETAIYWVEYVCRHNGAYHLRNSGMDLSFIQYHNIDAIAVLYGVLFIVLFVIFKVVKFVLSLAVGTKNQKKGKKKSHRE